MDEPEQPAKRKWWQHPSVGWALFILGVVERVIGWGGSIDFILARTGDPGWVGAVLRTIADHFEYAGFLMIVGGALLILWNERRRYDQALAAKIAELRQTLAKSAAPERVIPPSALPEDYEVRARLGVTAMRVLLAQEKVSMIDGALASTEGLEEAEVPPPDQRYRGALTMGNNPMRKVEPLRRCAAAANLPLNELDEMVRHFTLGLAQRADNFALTPEDEKHQWRDIEEKKRWLNYQVQLKAHRAFLRAQRNKLSLELSALRLTKDVEIPPQ